MQACGAKKFCRKKSVLDASDRLHGEGGVVGLKCAAAASGIAAVLSLYSLNTHVPGIKALIRRLKHERHD